MESALPSVQQLSQIIGSVAAPAFLLGAVAAFVSVLVSRLNRVIDRSQTIHRIQETDPERGFLRSDIPRLRRRARLLNAALVNATLSAVVTALIIVVAFVSAMLNLRHEYGVALLFMVALIFFVLSLFYLTREIYIGLADLDHHA